MKAEILNLIYDVIDTLNQQFDGEKVIEKQPTTVLFGKNAVIDSLELINFIVLTEQKIEEHFNVHIILADERALQMHSNPFENIQSLTKYIEVLCHEHKIKL